MRITIFKPTDQYVGHFEIETAAQLPEKLKKFLASQPPLPAYSYVEGYSLSNLSADSQIWTLVSIDPLVIQDGRVAKPKEGSPQTRVEAVAPSTPLIMRYAGAYKVGQLYVSVGDVAGKIGKVVGILTILIGILFCASDSRFLSLLIMGPLFWLLIWWAGLMTKAIGQMMMAQLDCAVNTSPFLSNEQRAEIMSIK